MNASRRAVLINALATPVAMAFGGAPMTARAAGAGPLRDWVVVNTLGGLFDPERPGNDAITIDTNVDAVTERSLHFAREAGMTVGEAWPSGDAHRKDPRQEFPPRRA